MPEFSIVDLKKEDFSVSSWSGGTTTQLAIEPENAEYKDRDFLWRVSSATVELEESVFTPLPDYERLIMTLEGEMELAHNGGDMLRLPRLKPHSFDGADKTVSRGKVIDFNLMMRKGQCEGILRLLPETGNMTAMSLTEGILYCFKGSLSVFAEGVGEKSLSEGNALKFTGLSPEVRLSWRTKPDTIAVFAGIINNNTGGKNNGK